LLSEQAGPRIGFEANAGANTFLHRRRGASRRRESTAPASPGRGGPAGRDRTRGRWRRRERAAADRGTAGATLLSLRGRGRGAVGGGGGRGGSIESALRLCAGDQGCVRL